MTIYLGASHWLTISELQGVAEKSETEVYICDDDRERMDKAKEVLNHFVGERLPIYGVTTQFGDDAYRVTLKGGYAAYLDSVRRRQNDVVRALGCGLGEECSRDIVRATLLLRAHTLARGASGVRQEVVDAILALLNHDICPAMYRYGSVGASGDLIPLSAIALTLMGEHEVFVGGKHVPAKEALERIKIAPLELQMKEGLAIVNGTSFMTALAALAVHKLCHILPISLAVAASCVEAMQGMDSPYESFVHESKHHSGQIRVAEFIRNYWEGSGLIRSLDTLRLQWREAVLSRDEILDEHVQDFYSLRALAHGFGPFYEDLERAVRWVEEEMNSDNDNPIIDVEKRKIHHGANFLGDYISVACDQLRADIAKASTWLHALLNHLVHPRRNRGLPSNLVRNPNQQTGFKTLLLLVASLAIHNRNRTLPFSAVMLPTEGDTQDMVSLGTHSAFDLFEVAENYVRITAVMIFAAAQAIELRGLEKAGKGSQIIHSFVRNIIPFVESDRPLSKELELLISKIKTEKIFNPWFLV